MKRIDTAERNIYYHCLEYDHEQIGDLFLVACGMENCDPGVTYGPDLRDCYHLHIVKSGAGVLFAGGKEHVIHGGQMFLLKHNETVSYTADNTDPWCYCWVTFNGSEAAELIKEIGFDEGIYCLESRVDPALFYELVLRMHQRPEMSYINDLFRRGILLEFLALAMEAAGAEDILRQKREPKPIEFYIDRAVDFIKYNYATIQVSDVMRFIGFSRGYFSGVFHKKMGMSIQDYLLRVRARKAMQLLTETNLPVGEIARQVGYEDQLNFSRVFRKITDMSPSGYRQAAFKENIYKQQMEDKPNDR